MGRPDKCGSSHWKCSVKKKAVFKNSANFTGKHLLEFVFMKVRPATLLKLRLQHIFSCEICDIFKNTYFEDLPHENCVYILYTKTVQDVYNWCIQNVCHISTNFCRRFVYKVKRTMPAKFCIQNVDKSLSKCGIHFVYKHFVYNLYTSILIYRMCTSQTLCIQFVYQIHAECMYK